MLQANKFGRSSCQPCRIEDLWRYCTGIFISLIYNVLWKTCLCLNDSSYLNWRVVKFRLRCYMWNVAIFSIFLALIIINNCDFLCWTHWGVYCGPLNLFRWDVGYAIVMSSWVWHPMKRVQFTIVILRHWLTVSNIFITVCNTYKR